LTYHEALDWLYATQLIGIKLGLENPRRLLREYLAYPPHGAKVIHVAGTNGKGSTCAFIDAVARAGGMRTGLFTSPHLVRYGERVRVAGVEIGEDEIARHLTALRDLVAGWETHPTFFELTLALGLRHFAERNCELLILETGMGGRLDATTAVPADVAVLTPISLDHQQWLGDTIEEIAGEKAAIIRPGKPAFSAPQEPAVRTVIAQTANERRAPLEFLDEPLLGYSLSLPGDHQRHNAALAVAALYAIGAPLNYDTVQAGLASTSWPGRFEVIPPEISHLDCELTLDIAHNPGAAEILAEAWRRAHRGTKANLIFGAVAAKDVAGIFDALLPIAANLRLVPVNSSRGLSTGELLAFLPTGHPPVQTFPTVQAALAVPSALPTLVTGSAFLVGEVKALLEGCSHTPTAQ
jgi:dihydrofolate synthase/folylpolyglutamate synthase